MVGSAFKVEFDTSQLEKFVNSLSKFNPSELLDNIGALVETQTQDRFVSETDPDGKKWVAWSSKYKKSGKGINILRNTQRLFGSINYQVKGNNVEVGSNVEYSAVHNYGYEKRKIPKRTFLGMGEQNKKDVDNLVKLYMEDL
jgi:phage virion morphogenesis protein